MTKDRFEAREKKSRFRERENQKDQAKKKYIGILVVFIIAAWFALSSETAPEKKKVFKEISNLDEISSNTSNKTPAKVVKKKPKYTLPSNWKSVKIVCGKLYTENPPSQEELNVMIKKLHFLKKEENGDVHNLMARLYWYKMHLDKENLFEKSWIDRWKKERSKHFTIAKGLYSNTTHRSSIKLKIKVWMPEIALYKKRFREKNRVEYKSSQKAAEDVSYLLNSTK